LFSIFPFLRWTVRGGIAVIDQSLISGTNFLISVLLARWLGPSQYGAYALAYSIFLLLATFHTAILTEPMMVFGSGKYSKENKNYFGLIIYGHISLMIPIIFLLLLSAFVLGRLYSFELRENLVGLAFAAPMTLLFWAARRAQYVNIDPSKALLGSLIYSILLLGIVFFLYRINLLSGGSVFISMGVCALLASMVLIYHLHPIWNIKGNLKPMKVVSDHWCYGRWALALAGLSWFPTNIYYSILPIWIGLEGAAALKAITNFALPLLHVIGAISLLLLPLLASYWLNSKQNFTNVIKISLAFFILISVLYAILLLFFKGEIFSFLYGNKYENFSNLIPFVLLLPFVASFTSVLGGALRSMEHPEKIFWSYVVSTIIVLIIGVPLVISLGIRGALYGMFLSSMSTATMMYLFYKYFQRKASLLK